MVLQGDLFGGDAVAVEPDRNGNMMKDFIIPPFSILDTSQSYWLERKRAWLSLGIESELGRGANLIGYSDTANKAAGFQTAEEVHHLMFDKTQGRLNEIMGGDGFKTGTSVFDPVLCEIVYRWFCPPKAVILDPFAGGSVRGIVAAKLGHIYKGIDLSAHQIEANLHQAAAIIPENKPLWFWGDSAVMLDDPKVVGMYDFIFSCPPYFDLEVYSNEAGELSAMDWPEFLSAYKHIIKKSVFMLKPNRFACFVVGEIRDKAGIYRNFVGETIAAFEGAGAEFYNEAILVTSVGSLPIRAGKQFKATRKLGKRHQNVLLFVKGEPKAAAEACGDIDTTSSFWSMAGSHAPELAKEIEPAAGDSANVIAPDEIQVAPNIEPGRRILFIIPPYRTTDALVAQLYPMPYGPVILGTILQEAGHYVEIKDFLLPAGIGEKIERPDSFAEIGHNPPYLHFGQPLEDCKSWIKENAPKFDAVGLAMGQCNIYETGRALAEYIKWLGLPLVVGGPFATTAPEQVQALTNADVIVIGEGENVVEQAFAKAIAGEKEWVFGTKADIEKTPLPDWRLAPPENYPKYNGKVRGCLTISRGCPWDCSFCSVHTIMSRKHRRLDQARIEAELKNLYDMGVRYFCFLDDNLFIHEKAVGEIMGAIDNLDKTLPGFDKCRFYCEEGMEVRVAAKPGVIKEIAAHRFDNIAIGLETVNAKQVENIRKPYDDENFMAAVENCKAAGITAKAFYIIGFPGDTVGTVSADLVEFGKIGFAARPNNLKLYPGTEMTQKYLEAGWIDENYDWRLASWHTPTSGSLDMPQIKKLKTILGAIGKAADDFGFAVFADDFNTIFKCFADNNYQIDWRQDGGLELVGNMFRPTPLRHILAMLLIRAGAHGAETVVDGDKITALPSPAKNEIQAAIYKVLHGEEKPIKTSKRPEPMQKQDPQPEPEQPVEGEQIFMF